jgi:hypothetical protein
MSKFEELIQAIEERGKKLEGASLALGLLIERHRTKRRQGDDGGVRQQLGDDVADLQLTDEDIAQAIDHLIAYLDSTDQVASSAVWALSKSYESRAVPPLISVLRRTFEDTNQYAAAHNALQGVITCGVSSELKTQAIEAIRDTARLGFGDIQTEAQEYLQHFDHVSERS